MSSVRRIFTPLALALLLIALPWTATASASDGKDGVIDVGCSITITTSTSDNGVSFAVIYSGLETYNQYQYYLKVYRVDQHYRHMTKSGNFTVNDYDADGTGDDVHVNESWMPTQDGPYTVTASVYDFDGNFITQVNSSFGWGNVEENSASAWAEISASPEQDYYDFADDVEAQKNVTINFGAGDLEDGATYSLQYRMFRLEEGDDGTFENRMFSMTTFTSSATYNMSALGNTIDEGWENDTTYRLELNLWLQYEDGYLVATDEMLFTVGEGPPEVQPLHDLELSCDLDIDGKWYEEYGVGDTDLQLDCNLFNPNPVSINGTSKLNYTSTGSAEIHNTFENFTIDANGTQAETFYLNWLDEPHELNGTLTLNFYFQEEEASLWNGKSTSFTFDFVIVQEDTYGCIDPDAENYSPEATVNDGSCIYEEKGEDLDQDGVEDDEDEDDDADGWSDVIEIECGTDPRDIGDVPIDADNNGICDTKEPPTVSIIADKSGGVAPLNVSFSALITGGIGPYTIEWEVGTSLISSPEINYQFPAGEHVIVLSVVDDNGRSATDLMEISVSEPVEEPPVVDPLTGYIAYSLQMNSTIENMSGAIEFKGVASGGVTPYSYEWTFEWMDYKESFLFEDKQQSAIQTANGEIVIQDFANFGNYTVSLTITDNAGSNYNTEVVVEIVKSNDDDVLILEPEPPKDDDQQAQELGILIASTGGLGLLMLFGLAGRKRKDDLLEKLRAQNADGWSTEETALWEDDFKF